MLLRQPISWRWRVLLGIISVVLLLGYYVWLSRHRQSERRELQRATAARMLPEVDQQIEQINQQIQQEGSNERLLQRLEALTTDRQRWLEQQEHPDAVDLTVPTLGVLYRDGLLRVLEPQGLRRKEVWLWEDSKATLGRLATGLIIGAVASVALGLLMGCYAAVESFFLPTLAFLAKIPPTAMLAVFFVLVGTTFKMYVVMIVFGMLPTLAQAICGSVRKDVPEEMIFKAYTLGASQIELIWDVTYKQILPRIIDAARLQIGPAMVLLVAAEWMVSDAGFGYRLRLFYQRTDMTVVYIYCALLGLGGLAVDYFLIWLRRRICPWFGE